VRKDLKRARAYALRLLDYRERSKQEIRDKMREKGYGQRLIEEVLQYLEAHKFINEKRFACVWGESRIRKGYGKRRTYLELKQKGLDTDLIDEVLDKLYSSIDEVEIAFNLIKKRKSLLGDSRKSSTRRIYEFLKRRGFSFEVIDKVITEIKPQVSQINKDS